MRLVQAKTENCKLSLIVISLNALYSKTEINFSSIFSRMIEPHDKIETTQLYQMIKGTKIKKKMLNARST